MPSDLSHFVPNPVDHRLTQIALHRADVLRLKQIQPFQKIERGILNKVAGVQVTACRHRQLPVCPAPQLREASLEEGLGRHAISSLRPNDELERRLVAEQVLCLLSFGGLRPDKRRVAALIVVCH
jgi:hypothetical protein